MTLTGTGDLLLHAGTLHIQPPTLGYPSAHAPWRVEPPPKTLLVSGGALGVTGGGAEIASTRTNAPALAVSVGFTQTNGEEGVSSAGPGAGFPAGEEPYFSYSGVALSVNVRETPNAANSSPFKLLELSVGGGEEDAAASEEVVLLSVGGDGRVSMAGGGGVVLGEGDLEVSQGNAMFKVRCTFGGGARRSAKVALWNV